MEASTAHLMWSRSRVTSQGSQSCPCALVAESVTIETQARKDIKEHFVPADLQNLQNQAHKDNKVHFVPAG